MNHDEAPPESVHAKRDISLLFVHRVVCYCDRHVIEQHSRGVGKVDTVILEVGGSFAAVPFELH